MRRALIPLSLCIALALLAGCTATSVTLSFEAIKPVNQLGEDGTGDSRVVEVRIYQLKDDAKFKEFIDLLKAGVSYPESLQQSYGATPEQFISSLGATIGIPNLRP